MPRRPSHALGKALVLAGLLIVLSGCEEPGGTDTGGSAYYDSVMWNDYYYAPPAGRPPHRPDRPVARPPIARPPVARPPIARPPVHRPR